MLTSPRRFDKQGVTNFITAFYAVPTGVGRSRLLVRYCRSIAPSLKLPTWLVAIQMNRFLVSGQCCGFKF